MTTASDDEDIHFDDEDDVFLAAALELSLKDQHFSGAHQDAGTSKYSDSRECFDGFDNEAGKSWIYPTNYPLRDYQFSIVQKGLFSNTLVSLPTGLGKTFIAAVIMFNFYRWYPDGKIIFMAPTKPLVAQQIEACFNVMGIPQNHMAEMTGSMNPTERKVQWKVKRIFFLTPQVMTNDISRGNCPAKLVKCLVVDEAHKALGNHSYAVVVKEVAKVNRQFRVLALSATPGSDVNAVQQIITNLLISNVEIRMEDSIDIMPYTHGKIIEKIIVPLGDHLESVKQQFMKFTMIYVERLMNKRVLWKVNPENLTTFTLLKERDKFRQNPPETLPRSEFGKVEADFAMSMSLYHAYELLQVHGLRSFYNFLKGILNGEKGMPNSRNELQRNSNFCQLFQDLEASFEPANISNQPSTSTTSPSALHCTPKGPVVVSHPKMQKLVEIMLEHFRQHKEESNRQNGHILDVGTRAMVFSQYRDSVAEITDLLNKHDPLIKAMQFIGQGSGTSSKGLSQKLQLQVVSRFRNGGFNTLVSTCVGEEGLDIGEVDLIVCYDAHKSPIRLVQRIGRTGRKRQGRIIMLITKGKEERTYNQGQLNKRNIDRTIARGSEAYDLYPMNPRMVPAGIHPFCNKISIVTETFQTTSMIKQKVNSAKTLRKGDSAYLTEDELTIWNSKFKLPTSEVHQPPQPMAMLSLKSPDIDYLQKRQSHKHLSLTDWLPWQNVRQPPFLVSHSKNTEVFVDMIQTIQVYTQLEDDNNSYGLELAPFFDKQDVLQHAEKDVATKSRISDFFPVVSKLSQTSRAGNDLTTPNKTKTPTKMPYPRKRPQLKRLLFSTDSDDDFCSISSPRKKSAEKDVKRAKHSTVKDSDITVVSNTTRSLWDPNNNFFSLPADIPECPGSPVDKTMPRVRLKTPPPSPPSDIVEFRLWLNNFHLPVKVEQVISPKVRAVSKQEATMDDLFADDLDLGVWDEGCAESVVACDPSAFVPGVPKESIAGVLKSAPTSPVFNSAVNNKSTTENKEADTSSIGQRSMYSVTQLVDMLHTDSSTCESPDIGTLPVVSKATTSKFRFKSLSKKNCMDEQDTIKACVPKSLPAEIEGRSRPTTSSYSTVNSVSKCVVEGPRKKLPGSINSVFKYDGQTPSRLDALPRFPKALNKDLSNTNKECPKMYVHPYVPSPTRCNDDIIDSLKMSENEISTKSKASFSPLANFQQGDSDEPGIIPPSPNRADMSSKFKFKFKSMRKSSLPDLPLVSNLCLSPIGIVASKDNEHSALPARPAAALAASTPARVPSNETTTVELDDDEFIRHNRKRNRKLVTSPEAEGVTKTSLPKRKSEKLHFSRDDNVGRQYLEEEAEVCDLGNSSDEDEHISGIDHYEESFIDDRLHPTQFTQTKQGDISKMAMYLRSIRSPPVRPGAFKLPSMEVPATKACHVSKDSPVNVFSQQPSSDDSDYLNDSFCVDNDFVEYAQTQDAITPTRPKSDVKPTAKRKRIFMMDASTTSSEDEQIMDLKLKTDPSVITSAVIPNKTTHYKFKRGLSTSAAASTAVSSRPSHITEKRMHDPPTSRSNKMPISSAIYDAFNPGPSTSTTANNAVCLNPPDPCIKSKTAVTSSPSSLDMANFRPVILVNSMEMASGQETISCLNVQHQAKVAIANLNHCDYIISNRMGVERKLLSDVANSALRRPLLLRIRDMISRFERPCLIIENERVKPKEKPRLFVRTKYFDNTMACLAQTPVKILFSQSQEETAQLLVDLSRHEFRKGSAIDVPLEVYKRQAKHLKFYSTLPNVSYVVGLNFCANFSSVMEFLRSSPVDFEEKGKIPRSRAELIYKYLHHEVSCHI